MWNSEKPNIFEIKSAATGSTRAYSEESNHKVYLWALVLPMTVYFSILSKTVFLSPTVIRNAYDIECFL